MKKVVRFCLAICLFTSLGWSNLQASNVVPINPTATERPSAQRIQELTQRVEEIRAMDKSKLSASERKALRKEVRQIKKAVGGGVYISAGALIVLLIVLILVL